MVLLRGDITSGPDALQIRFLLNALTQRDAHSQKTCSVLLLLATPETLALKELPLRLEQHFFHQRHRRQVQHLLSLHVFYFLVECVLLHFFFKKKSLRKKNKRKKYYFFFIFF
jgi:hypothetical protein